MKPLRVATFVVVLLLAAVPVGSGLAALAQTRPNDACSDFGDLPEGSVSGSSFDLWPLGVRCAYYGTAGQRRSESFRASLGEQWAWIAFAALLAGCALRMRNSSAVRGGAAAAAMLGLAGAIWMYAGFQIAWVSALVLYAPLVFGIDVLLRPREQRSWVASALTAAALVATVMAILILVLFNAYAGIAMGIVAGAAVGSGVGRWRSRRGDLLPSH